MDFLWNVFFSPITNRISSPKLISSTVSHASTDGFSDDINTCNDTALDDIGTDGAGNAFPDKASVSIPNGAPNSIQQVIASADDDDESTLGGDSGGTSTVDRKGSSMNGRGTNSGGYGELSATGDQGFDEENSRDEGEPGLFGPSGLLAIPHVKIVLVISFGVQVRARKL